MDNNPQLKQPDQTPHLLYNPDVKEHSFWEDKMGPNPKQYTVPALQSLRLPKYLAQRFADELADIMVNKNGIRTNYQAEKEKMLAKILIPIT